MIFCLPRLINQHGLDVAAPSIWPKEPLAYVTWFSRFKPTPDRTTGMYKIDPSIGANGVAQGAIVPLSHIRQSCMLVPSRGIWEEAWTSQNILDNCSSFFVNNLQTKYTYQNIY